MWTLGVVWGRDGGPVRGRVEETELHKVGCKRREEGKEGEEGGKREGVTWAAVTEKVERGKKGMARRKEGNGERRGKWINERGEEQLYRGFIEEKKVKNEKGESVKDANWRRLRKECHCLKVRWRRGEGDAVWGVRYSIQGVNLSLLALPVFLTSRLEAQKTITWYQNSRACPPWPQTGNRRSKYHITGRNGTWRFEEVIKIMLRSCKTSK